MSKLTASYLAGLIDGEGCLEILKRKKEACVGGYYYVARLRISSVDKEIIEWLKNSFGGFIYYRKGKGNERDSWTWTIQFMKAKRIIDAVYPYLRIKKRQAEILKHFFATYKPESYKIVENKIGKNGTGYHKELKDEIREKREKLHRQIRELNRRGLAR